MGRSVESNQKFSTGFRERRHTSPLKKSQKNCGGLAEMFEELRIICHYPTSHRLPVPVCIMCQSQRTGLQNTLLDPLLTRLQSRTFQLPESGQSKRTHKKNKTTNQSCQLSAWGSDLPSSDFHPLTTQVEIEILRSEGNASLQTYSFMTWHPR